ncbi:MAG: hypothetical protein OEY55_12540 [Acidimicrobiia bacterium]|nr:hypothetical protein [Acidimicrobiia bacterium]MDH5422623.1 hypothetical protein [Acidimicrobiia bacterium]MDH5503812.1 hypothetical protein [Acidimicrobiia bacterium]
MALATNTDLLPVAALACADAYSAHGSSVIIKDHPFVTVFSDADTAEIILDDVDSIEGAIGYVGQIAEVWNVVVVIPAELIGVAHRVLRGRFHNVELQPWWTEANRIWFGRVEVP